METPDNGRCGDTRQSRRANIRRAQKYHEGNTRQARKHQAIEGVKTLGRKISGRCGNTGQCEALEQREDTKQARRHQAGQVWNNQGSVEKSGVDTPGNEWRRDIAKCWIHQAMNGVEILPSVGNTRRE